MLCVSNSPPICVFQDDDVQAIVEKLPGHQQPTSGQERLSDQTAPQITGNDIFESMKLTCPSSGPEPVPTDPPFLENAPGLSDPTDLALREDAIPWTTVDDNSSPSRVPDKQPVQGSTDTESSESQSERQLDEVSPSVDTVPSTSDSQSSGDDFEVSDNLGGSSDDESFFAFDEDSSLSDEEPVAEDNDDFEEGSDSEMRRASVAEEAGIVSYSSWFMSEVVSKYSGQKRK